MSLQCGIGCPGHCRYRIGEGSVVVKENDSLGRNHVHEITLLPGKPQAQSTRRSDTHHRACMKDGGKYLRQREGDFRPLETAGITAPAIARVCPFTSLIKIPRVLRTPKFGAGCQGRHSLALFVVNHRGGQAVRSSPEASTSPAFGTEKAYGREYRSAA